MEEAQDLDTKQDEQKTIKISLMEVEKMAGFGFDSGALKANGKAGDMYVVLQVVLTEKFIGTGSGVSSLSNFQATINAQAAKRRLFY